ncbi:SprT-like family-domain-containing protein [Trametes gibbosa]|nr:SprT-like family-domain-containing protein [Trametes gibbosa]
MNGEVRWETIRSSQLDSPAAPECTHRTLAKDVHPHSSSRSPTKFTPGGGPFRNAPLAKEDSRKMGLAVSDSEEERQRRMKLRSGARVALASMDINEKLQIIEILDSDDEDEAKEEASDASVIAQNVVSQIERSNGALVCQPARRPHQTPRARRIVISSDSEDDVTPSNDLAEKHPSPTTPVRPARRRLPLDDDIIDLTISSPEPESRPTSPKASTPLVHRAASTEERDASKRKGKGKRQTTQHVSAAEDSEAENDIPLFVESDKEADAHSLPEDPFDFDDGSILVLNEPRSARKPLRKAHTPAHANTGSPFTPFRPFQSSGRPQANALDVLANEDSSADETDSDALGLDPVKPKSRPAGIESNARPALPSPAPTKAGKAPRMTAKMRREAELERLRAYAADFFSELNDTVFGGGIPETTQLLWSKRLLTTAGKAQWYRKSGKTSIQLAEKILDNEERIRNTLAHEMCHLASWLVSNAPNEQHGAIFKGWGREVMKKRSDVEVTTKHDYEISHKYQWKCEDCSKVYGRHSKSINPEEHACGACQGGRLVPQFQTRQRAPRTPKPKMDSQNAATRSRDSPLVMPGAFPSAPALRKETRATLEIEHDDCSDIELLAHTFKSVQIAQVIDD